MSENKNDEVFVPQEVKKSGLQKVFLRLHKKLSQEYEGGIESIKRFANKRFNDLESNLVAEYKKLRDSTDSWIKKTDIELSAFEKKYAGLYTVLTRTFLVDIEKRIMSQEIFTQAILDLMLEKMYFAETGSQPVGGHFKIWREKIAKRHQELMQKIGKDIIDLKAKESISGGKSNSETEGVDSGTNRDGISNGRGGNGTTNRKVDQEAQSPT